MARRPLPEIGPEGGQLAQSIDETTRIWLKEWRQDRADLEKIERQLETLAQERDTARELCRDAIQARNEARGAAAQLGEQLVEAMDTVQVFHGRPGWELYRDHSPEMDRWRTTLRAAGVRVPPHLMPGGVE